MAQPQEEPNTLSRQVVEHLGRDIVAMRRPPGSVLRIEDLQHDFSVSRTVIRDVLRHLDSLRLTSSRPRVGILVREMTDWNVFAPDVVRWRLTSDAAPGQLRSLTELRGAIEPQAVALAALTAPEEVGLELVELADALAASAAAQDLDAFLVADLRFHALVLQHCGNEMFAALEVPIAEALRARHARHLVPDRPRDIAVLLHQLVATGIRDRDAATAEAAMRQLVAEAGATVTDARHRT